MHYSYRQDYWNTDACSCGSQRSLCKLTNKVTVYSIRIVHRRSYARPFIGFHIMRFDPITRIILFADVSVTAVK